MKTTAKPTKKAAAKKAAVKTIKAVKPSLKKVTIVKHPDVFAIYIDGKLQTNKTGSENSCKQMKAAIETNMKAQVNIYKAQNRTEAEAIQFTNDQY